MELFPDAARPNVLLGLMYNELAESSVRLSRVSFERSIVTVPPDPIVTAYVVLPLLFGTTAGVQLDGTLQLPVPQFQEMAV